MNNARTHIEYLINFDNYDNVDDFASAIDKMEGVKTMLDCLMSHVSENYDLQDGYDDLYADLRELYDNACMHVKNWNAYVREFEAAECESLNYASDYYSGSRGL